MGNRSSRDKPPVKHDDASRNYNRRHRQPRSSFVNGKHLDVFLEDVIDDDDDDNNDAKDTSKSVSFSFSLKQVLDASSALLQAQENEASLTSQEVTALNKPEHGGMAVRDNGFFHRHCYHFGR